MLRRTFHHISGIGQRTEWFLWQNEIYSWDALMKERDRMPLGPRMRKRLLDGVTESMLALEKGDVSFFYSRLPSSSSWRIYPEFRNETAYIDIETTGLYHGNNHITTIALYDGTTYRTFIRGINLEDFPQEIMKYSLLVTFNGKCFDIPFIEKEFGISLNHAHIDLHYLLRRLGYRGGLKAIESNLNINRGEALTQVDGYCAVLLWKRYRRGDERALEVLLRYNVEDVINLKTLLHFSYNRLIEKTPFKNEIIKDTVKRPEIHYPLHEEVVREILREARRHQGYYNKGGY